MQQNNLPLTVKLNKNSVFLHQLESHEYEHTQNRSLRNRTRGDASARMRQSLNRPQTAVPGRLAHNRQQRFGGARDDRAHGHRRAEWRRRGIPQPAESARHVQIKYTNKRRLIN